MTPAVELVRKSGIRHEVHEYGHDEGSESWGIEAAEKLGVDPKRVYKTLVVELDSGTLAVGIVPVSATLDLKALARAASAKKAKMADPVAVERVTGYVLGGVSPLGQKRKLATVIDESAQSLETMLVSAGRRGLEIELSALDLAHLTEANFAGIAK